MFLILPIKTSKRYDIASPLGAWVEQCHPLFTADQVKDDLVRLSSLRNDLTGGSICTAYSHSSAIGNHGLEDCMQYHACLLEAENRGFPLLDDAAVGATELKLSWACAFSEEEPIIRSNIRYERACVLYNVAALKSHLAASEDLATKEGRSRAKLMFGQTASTLAHLRTELMAGSSKDPAPSADLSEPTLLMCEHIQLAQGQVCVYEAATSRSSTIHGLLAKIAMAASQLYGEALSYSQDAMVKSRLPNTSKAWGAHLKTMSINFRARAEWHQSNVEKIEYKYGLEIARLQFACSCCDEALKYQSETAIWASQTGAIRTAGGGVALSRNIKQLRSAISSRKSQAEQDNKDVFREIIPAEKDLEKIAGASMMTADKLPPLADGLDPKFLERSIFPPVL